MKKALMIFALCALCGSAFAAVTVSDWYVYHFTPADFVGLIDDIAPNGFEVHGNPEIWSESKMDFPFIWYDGDSPWIAFKSDNVSPGLFINYETTTFEVYITGFNNLVVHSMWPNEEPVHAEDNIQISFHRSDGKGITYKTLWNGEGVYTFGYDQLINKNLAFDFEVSTIRFYLWTIMNSGADDCYHFGDNTVGTVEFIFPDAEVPEPSSLLALAFGGAGTALAIRRRK